jgi:serine/threonine protein kinase
VTERGDNKRADAMLGRVLSDRYRIDELIASGAMASVYRGLHLKMRKQVAIKILHPETEDFPELVTRFEREAVAGAHIDHPNVAAASDMGTFDDGSYFLVLEFVKGRTLRDLVAREGPLTPKRAVHLARQLASALAAAHAKGIIHRDLKPRNVMVTDGPDECVKLIDFGLARVIVQEVAPLEDDPNPMKKSLSATGVIFGTVGYMAPETAFGMKAVEARSDLYSLGVILYEMLSGDHPFSAIDPRELFLQHRSAKPASLVGGSQAIPPALDALVMSLLEKDPSARPANAEKVIRALDESLGPGAPDLPSEHIVVTVPPPSKSARRVVVVVGVALALGASAGAWALWGRPKGPSAVVSTSPPIDAGSSPTTSAIASSPGLDPSALGARNATDAAVTERLRKELVASLDPIDAAAILVELAEVAPGALRDAETRAAATKAADAVASKGNPQADRVYYVLAYKFGADGLDVLYDLELGASSPKAAQRAAAILDIQGASARATPALRIALDLAKTVCREKPLLLDRAVADGDERALAALQKLEPPSCSPAPSQCCFARSAPLERAIAALQAKLHVK